MVEKAPFFRSPFPVSRVGIGFGLGGVFSPTSRINEFESALRHGLDLGFNLVDTAMNYAAGQSERVLGKILQGRATPHLVATKVSPSHFAGPRFHEAVTASLRRLRREQIDVLYLHWPNPAIPKEETLEAIRRELDSGNVGNIGLSNFSLKDSEFFLKELPEGSLACIQHEYNLFDRSAEQSLIPWASDRGIAFVGYSPLDQGQIIGGGSRLNRLKLIARRENCTVAQLALNWLLLRSPVFLIPSTSRTARVREFAALDEVTLSPDTQAEIEELSANVRRRVQLSEIEVLPDATSRRKVYLTLEEAIDNSAEFSPGPLDLANELLEGGSLKPIRVVVKRNLGRDRFILAEGRLRYWAHMIAFGPKHSVDVLVRASL